MDNPFWKRILADRELSYKKLKNTQARQAPQKSSERKSKNNEKIKK